MKFIKGRYYQCTLQGRGYMWNSRGEMDAVIGAGPIMCTEVDEYMTNYAMFACVPRSSDQRGHCTPWQWADGDFIEVHKISLEFFKK